MAKGQYHEYRATAGTIRIDFAVLLHDQARPLGRKLLGWRGVDPSAPVTVEHVRTVEVPTVEVD